MDFSKTIRVTKTLEKAGQAKVQFPSAGQVLGIHMNASGRQTAPPDLQADFATFPRVSSHEAFLYGFDLVFFRYSPTEASASLHPSATVGSA